jgi:hypothetical protein
VTPSPLPDPSLRASDADRERATTQLRDHAAAGRLDAEELDERLDRALTARTTGELAALTRDLPDEPGPRRDVERRRALHEAGASLAPFLICVLIWAATGAGSFWPVWLLIPAAIGIGGGLWRAYGPASGLTDEELKDPRERDRGSIPRPGADGDTSGR